ncbi:Uncharacterised protein [Leclercia adecarboxylata]|uniref:Uncharacterized protein n=1 Tax=Leclercia adecarboxylata TaxID=83655 RepID=A0A4U9HJL5_9ENTR|nr:Uncharacterised protein [Leclercia adecarboxylata]
MKLPIKPHLLALICSAGLFAASGVVYVNSRTTETLTQPSPPCSPPRQRKPPRRLWRMRR